MHERFMQSPLAISVLTGVTALVGGIEPAAAAIIPLSQSFGTISASDTENRGGAQSGSGSFSDSESDPTAFSQFDPMGGTRELTGVTVTVSSLSALVQASINANCAGSGITCVGSATNDSTFSVAIGLGGALTPTTQMLSAMASDSCTLGAGPAGCQYSETASTSTLPGQFSFTATVAQLSQFVGLGTFDVTPQLSLGGGFSWNHGPTSFENSLSANALSQWSGTIDVTYEFRLVNVVPEPASLFLVGAGLAGLGFARRKTQHV